MPDDPNTPPTGSELPILVKRIDDKSVHIDVMCPICGTAHGYTLIGQFEHGRVENFRCGQSPDLTFTAQLIINTKERARTVPRGWKTPSSKVPNSLEEWCRGKDKND